MNIVDVIKWQVDMRKAPEGKRILVKVDNGIFGGGKKCHFALKMGDQFFSAETKSPIHEVCFWADFG